jgi:hypothetical protein
VTTTLYKIDPVGTDNQGFISRQGQENFIFSKRSIEGIGSTQTPMEKYRGVKKIFSFLNIQIGYCVHSNSYGKYTEWGRESFLFQKVQRGYWVHSDSYGKCTEESVPG